MITPEQLAASGSEDGHQSALFCWRWQSLNQYPQLKYLFAIPNGGFRNKREAARLKATGSKKGASDIFFPVPIGRYAGLWIELKKPGFNRDKWLKDQPEQNQWLIDMESLCYAARLCIGWEQARDTLISYMEKKL